jgi:hypothetical protein
MMVPINYRNRLIEEQIKEKMKYSGGVLIEGAKWVGKSTTASIFAKTIVSLQHPRIRKEYEAYVAVLDDKILTGEKPILYDEWQDIPEIWDFIRIDIDKNSFKNDATYNDGFLEKKQELVSIITPLEALLAQLQTKFNEQTALVTDFNNKYETYSAITNDYELKYLYFLSSIDKLNALKTKVQVLNTVDFTDINAVIENKDLIISNLTEVELLLNEIKEIYTNTINAMYFYPNAFEPIANDMVNLVLKAAEVFGLFVPIKASFEALSAKIGEGIAGNWFNPLTLQGIGMLKGMLDHEDPTGEQPGIIQALGMVVEGTAGMAEQIEGLQSLINMYAFDPEIQMRQIDALYLGFVQINHGLLLKAEGQEASFYDGIYQLASMKDFVALIPTPLNIDLPSFLSDDNESPLSLQFIVTEK